MVRCVIRLICVQEKREYEFRNVSAILILQNKTLIHRKKNQADNFHLLLIHTGAHPLCIRLNQNGNLLSLKFSVFQYIIIDAFMDRD